MRSAVFGDVGQRASRAQRFFARDALTQGVAALDLTGPRIVQPLHYLHAPRDGVVEQIAADGNKGALHQQDLASKTGPRTARSNRVMSIGDGA